MWGSWQAATYLAASLQQSSLSPRRAGSLSRSFRWWNSGNICVILAKYRSLRLRLWLQWIGKCSSVSIVPWLQKEHILSSLGSHVCLCRTTFTARLCSLTIYLSPLSLSLSLSLLSSPSLSIYLSLYIPLPSTSFHPLHSHAFTSLTQFFFLSVDTHPSHKCTLPV